jgi:hypothetical protein
MDEAPSIMIGSHPIIAFPKNNFFFKKNVNKREKKMSIKEKST